MNPPSNDARSVTKRRKGVDRSRLFTELSVGKLKLRSSEDAQVTYRDKKERGLLLRLNLSGGKAWRVQFYDKRLRKMRSEGLGEFRPGAPDHVSVKDARDRAAHFRANKRTILDERAKTAAGNTQSFKAVSGWYIETFVEGQRRSAGQIKAIINAILPTWGERAFEAITRPDVVELLDEIEQNRGPRAADVTLATIRKMMRRYASKHKTGVKNNYVPVVVDGMARIEDPSKRARKRTLTDREIRILFVACDRLGTFGNLCKVLLYTGQRRTLISTMRFDDVEEGLWEVPADDGAIGDQKGNIECVRLPKPVLEIIEAQAELQTNEFVFPASRVGRRDGPGENFGSFSAFGAGKAELDEAMAELSPDTPIPHWTLHDLRRTTGTLMPRLGIDDDHRERVLGHKLAGVKGVYNRYKYLDERSEALRKLATLIETIIRPPAKGGNVVSINRR